MSVTAQKKSLARTKMLGIFYASFFLGPLFFLSSNAYISAICLFLLVALSFSIFIIRCENCGVLVYRKKYNDHGFPAKNWQWVDKSCPVCGIERCGFIEGLKGVLQNKDQSKN